MHIRVLLTLLVLLTCGKITAQVSDSTKSKIPYFYNWTDTYLNRFNYNPTPLFSLNPKQVNTAVLFNPLYTNFTISESITPNIDVKTPEAISFNEYSSIQNAMLRRSIIRDIEKAQDGNTDFTGKRIRPKLETSKIFDRIFGDKLPEFKPQGTLFVSATHHRRRTDNPIPLYNMDRSYFDFDQRIAINFNNLFNPSGIGSGRGGNFPNNFPSNLPTGSLPTDIPNDGRIQDINNILRKPGEVREKLNMQGNFDTKSAFQFDNRLKINFKNEPEDILQVVELGNISFPNRSQLIPGIQNLLGAKIGVKFGKLDLVGVVAQQNSRTKSIVLNGGNQNKSFEVRADNYEENRHFFLSHFFRNNYENALRSLPIISSGIIVTRVEAYITNKTYSVETNRNILGLNDLGEATPFSDKITPKTTQPQADNNANSLHDDILQAMGREIDQLSSNVSSKGLVLGQDFEVLRGAKKLTDADFELNQELGYISLRTPLRNDEVLAVSFEYTYRGKRYKVGELTEDYVNRSESQAIVLKLLKSSNIRNNLKNPMWDLMMKNVYNLGQGQLKQDGFQLRIIYKNDNTGMDVPFLSDVPGLQSTPLLGLFHLDRLNYNNEIIGDGTKGGDGNFDFIEGVTVNSRYGRIIFPVLEPFGSHLAQKLEENNASQFKEKYVFQDLYDKTLSDAQQNTIKNKFFLSGTFVLGGADIALPLGASTGSVRVYSGGTELKQGVDFMVDPTMGTIRLTNPSLVNSGKTIRVDYEETDMFQTQIRRMFGLRADYTVNRNLRIGATLQDLRENNPGFTTRTSLGNEPVNNTIWGLDLNYKKNGYGLTRLLDALPGVQTKEQSTIMLNAEFAQLIPGVNIKRVSNSSMIDDFEYARNVNDLSRQANKWRLGSTPPEFQTETGTPSLLKGYEHHFRRAKMSVYSIDMTTYFSGQAGGFGSVIPPNLGQEARKNPFTANFNIQDILVGRSMPTFAEQVPTSILDIAYYPSEPGMYNYTTKLTPNGLLATDPKTNFGSIMRGITFDADFDNSNIEYLEFWMMNIFDGEIPLSTPIRNTKGGKLILQLGDVSEDVIPDGRFNFENGIKPDNINGEPTQFNRPYIYTNWGKAPDVQFMVDAFENEPELRKYQDVGFDGLSNEEEREYTNPNDPSSKGIKGYLDEIRQIVTNNEAFQKIWEDPSKDDFIHFLDPKFDQTNATFLERYKNYLGVENNSPYNHEGANATIVYSNTNLADKEDINNDNTINELEDYFEYEIDLRPDAGRGIANNKYIVDKVEVKATADRPATTWYLFRVPIKNYSKKYPETKEESFKSIRFMRFVTTDWEEPVVMRFATMQLVSNQYRKYQYKINDNTNDYEETPLDPQDRTIVNTTTVSIEENGCPTGVDCGDSKQFPYAVPPGFVRDINYASQARMEFNEQAMALTVEKLEPKDSRGVFKNTQIDLNMYKRIKMFVHMHSQDARKDKQGMFLRIGTDLKNNYYEIEIPELRATSAGDVTSTGIWPYENEIDVPLDELRNLKLRRNRNSTTATFKNEYSEEIEVDGTISGSEAPTLRKYRIAVKGNPDLSKIMTIMIGVRNNSDEERDYTIWTNELRAFGFDNQDKGSAGLMAADIKLADLGTLTVAGNFRNFGFGSVQDKISSRAKEDTYAYSGVLNLALDKFLPMKWGLSIPFYVNYDKQVSTPGFNPLDPDIRLDEALKDENKSPYHQNLNRRMVSDISTTTGFNFMDVHKVRSQNSTRNRIYDIENFTVSYAQNRIYRSNILMSANDQSFTSASIKYQYSPKGLNLEPFKNSTNLDSSAFKFLKGMSFNPIPSVISLKAYNEQVFYRTRYRDENLQDLPDQNLIKYYYGNRYYDLQWNLTKSISLNYNAHMMAIMDDVDAKTTAEQDIKFGQRLFSLGRAKNYIQKIRATWRIPLQDIYAFDWINANTFYDVGYSFKGVAFNQTDGEGYEFGNIIENNRDWGIDGRVDLVKFYNKFTFLKRANGDKMPRQRFTRAPGDDKDMAPTANELTRTLARLLMTARSINTKFAFTESTTLPGFTPIPKYFGLRGTDNGLAPGLDFVLGSQKESIISRAADNGWLSKSVQQYNPVVQRRGFNFEYSTNLEPFKGLRMVIRGTLSRNDDISYVYQPGKLDENGDIVPNTSGDFFHFSPVRGGSFKMSFWSFKTSFKKVNPSGLTGFAYEPFQNLIENRSKVIDILDQRLAIRDEEGNLRLDANSQDVLIPAFFAAYTGKDVNDIFNKKKYTRHGSNTFNPFLGFPMPNWQINYQGLEKLPGVRAMFNSITLSHSFVSTYSVGNFTSSLLYDYRAMEMLSFRIPLGKGYNIIGSNYNGISGINEFTNLFDPVYIMSSIVMEEKFAPFFGVNFTTKGNFTGNFTWNKDRMAMLNLSNAQVSENHGNDLIFGFGMKKNNITLPFKGRDGNNLMLKNDLIFKIDISFRDIKLLQRKLDGDAVMRNGAKSVQMRPNLSYQFNKRLSMTMFWEKQINTPYVSQVWYTNNASFGVTASFNLSE